MFQSFTKIFSKPKPKFSRSKILSFIENYDYLKGRKDPGATGLITVLSESECRVNLKNDVNNLHILSLLLDIVRCLRLLSVRIQNEDEIRKWVRSFMKEGLIRAYRKDTFSETHEAMSLEEYIGNIFSVSEKKRMAQYYKEILFTLIRGHKAPSSHSVIYLLNTCVLAMNQAGYTFIDAEKKEILDELMKFREGDLVFRSRSYVDRRATFHPDRESEDAYAIIEALDPKLAREYRKGFIKNNYWNGKFYSLDEKTNLEERKYKSIRFSEIIRVVHYREYATMRRDKRIIHDLRDFFDHDQGGFYFSNLVDRKAEGGFPDLYATFAAVRVLAELQYQFQP